MKILILALTLTLTLFTLLAPGASAQIPDKFTNLKVLPEDIGKRELVGIMRSFSMALGVRCTFCHEQETPGDFSSIKWPSDELKHKNVARGMISMLEEINSNLLPHATGEHDFQVRCVTCHRGVKHPETLDNLLLEIVAESGADSAKARYHELRESYYGAGSYDFSPRTLDTVAETLAQEKSDTEGARLMVLLNLEINPDHIDSYLMLAQLDLAGGDKDAARVNINKVLELEPDHRHAKRMLNQLGQ